VEAAQRAKNPQRPVMSQDPMGGGVYTVGPDGRPQFTSKRQAAAPRAPAVGTIKQGHRFIGGDPSKPESWEKV